MAWTAALAVIAGGVALASTARAGESARVTVHEGFASPNGRFAAIRVALHRGLHVDVLLFDLEHGTWRPLTHRIEMSATSPDDSRVAFKTGWGVSVASRGAPTVGRVVQRTWLINLHSGWFDDVCWVDNATVRVLSHDLMDYDLSTGARRDTPSPFGGHGSERLDESCEAYLPAAKPPPRMSADRPEVLTQARIFGWSAEGRLILQRAPGESYWLIDPDAEEGDVVVVQAHPGAVFDPRVELWRRTCGECRWEIWLRDARPGGRTRPVITSGSGGRVAPLEPPDEHQAKWTCAAEWRPMTVPDASLCDD